MTTVTDKRFPSQGVREAATVALGLVDFLDAACGGIIDAAIPGQEQSPLMVFARTQRIQMSIEEIREALKELIPSQAVVGLDAADLSDFIPAEPSTAE